MPINQFNDYEPPVSGGTIPIKLPGSYPGNVPQPRGYNPSPLPPPTDYYATRKEVRDLLAKYIETLMKLVENATEGNLATLGSDGQVIDSKVNLSVLTTLVGEDPNKSVRKIAEEEVEKVIAEAPEAFDTLKEIADWIKDDESGAAAMAASITEVKEELPRKVDKVNGKGLSTEDYTTAEKEKLGGIEAGAQANPDLSDYAKKGDIPYALIELPLTDSINLIDRSINKVAIDDSLSSITFIFPEKKEGVSRDFFLRLVITGETVPTFSFVELNGDAVSFDVDDESWAEIEQGVNILMFTDTEE